MALRGVRMFCNIPGGSVIGSAILPIISPINLIFCFLPIMFIIMFAFNPNITNSTDNKEKNWGRGSFIAFIIYYILASSCFCAIIKTSCTYV